MLSPLVTAASASALARVGLEEDVAVEARTVEGLAVESGQAPEGVTVLVDDDDGVALVGELHGQLGADSATADHDDMHAAIRPHRRAKVQRVSRRRGAEVVA